MLIVDSLKGAIGWLGGALAALTAICYSTGFFAFHTHLTMLGLGKVVELPHEQMLLEGARFFIHVAAHLLRMVMVVGFSVFFVLVSVALVNQIGPIRRVSGRVREWAGARGSAFHAARPALAGTALLAVLVLLLILHTDQYFYPLVDLGNISGLLFSPQAAENPTCRAPNPAEANYARVIASLVMQGDRCNPDPLDGEFQSLQNGFLVLLLAVVLTFALPATLRPVRLLRAFRFVLVAYALVFSLLMPVGFAVLVRSPVYPVAHLKFKDDSAVSGSLVARNDKNVLLWQASERKAIWYASGTIATIDVVGERNLFTRPEGDKE